MGRNRSRYKEKRVQIGRMSETQRRRGPTRIAIGFDALGDDHGRKTLLEAQAPLELENKPEGVRISA